MHLHGPLWFCQSRNYFFAPPIATNSAWFRKPFLSVSKSLKRSPAAALSGSLAENSSRDNLPSPLASRFLNMVSRGRPLPAPLPLPAFFFFLPSAVSVLPPLGLRSAN